MVKQISIFIENTSGRLAEITRIIADSNVNIHALSIADTSDFGILRLIVDKPDDAKRALKAKGLTVKTTEVLAISVPHTPGGLSDVLQVLVDANIVIEYMYAFTGRSINDSHAMVILRLDNQEKAMEVLTNAGIAILDTDDAETLNNM